MTWWRRWQSRILKAILPTVAQSFVAEIATEATRRVPTGLQLQSARAVCRAMGVYESDWREFERELWDVNAVAPASLAFARRLNEWFALGFTFPVFRPLIAPPLPDPERPLSAVDIATRFHLWRVTNGIPEPTSKTPFEMPSAEAPYPSWKVNN